MAIQPGDLLTHVHLYRILQELPTYGSVEGHAWQRFFPPDQSPSPQVMWTLARTEGNLAGVLSMRGVAIPIEKLAEDREFADMANIGASWRVDPLVVQAALDPGAFALVNNLESPSGQELLRKINDEMVGGATECLLMMERQREKFAIDALTKFNVQWPPLDAAGAAIANPMDHWNANMVINFNYTKEPTFHQKATTLAGYGGELGGQIAWNQPGAKILRDFRVIGRQMKKLKGLNAKRGRVVTDGITIETMAEQDEVRDLILGKNREQVGARDFVDTDTLVDFVENKLGWQIEEYAAPPWTYRTYTSGRAVINPVDYWPEGTLVFIPEGVTPGNMMESLHETQDGRFDYGNIPWFKRDDEPPYQRRGGVRAVAWPVFPHSKEIFVFKAFE